MGNKTDSADVSVAAPPSHTKGPWHVVDKGTHFAICQRGESGYHDMLAEVHHWTASPTPHVPRRDQAKANACLMAAASDLLEALKAARRMIHLAIVQQAKMGEMMDAYDAAGLVVDKATDSAATPAPDAK